MITIVLKWSPASPFSSLLLSLSLSLFRLHYMDKSKYDMRNEESDKNFMVCRVTAPFGVPGQEKKRILIISWKTSESWLLVFIFPGKYDWESHESGARSFQVFTIKMKLVKPEFFFSFSLFPIYKKWASKLLSLFFPIFSLHKCVYWRWFSRTFQVLGLKTASLSRRFSPLSFSGILALHCSSTLSIIVFLLSF